MNVLLMRIYNPIFRLFSFQRQLSRCTSLPSLFFFTPPPCACSRDVQIRVGVVRGTRDVLARDESLHGELHERSVRHKPVPDVCGGFGDQLVGGQHFARFHYAGYGCLLIWDWVCFRLFVD